MSVLTSFLKLLMPGLDGIADMDMFDDNMDKIDEWAEKVGDPENLEGVSKNIVTEVNKNKTAADGALPAGGVSEGYNTGKKIEDKIENLTSKEIIFDGLIDNKGIYTLSENWDNFDEIIFIGKSYSAVNIQHTTFYTDYITASDSTSEQAEGECRVYDSGAHLMSIIFRDTNRNELYCNEISGGRVSMIIGKGKKI